MLDIVFMTDKNAPATKLRMVFESSGKIAIESAFCSANDFISHIHKHIQKYPYFQYFYAGNILAPVGYMRNISRYEMLICS
jgi:hypothetical protein